MASNNPGDKRGNRQDSPAGSKQSARGFASMDPQRQREIASEGGRAAHQKGTAHEFTSEEARRAGSMSHKNDGNRQSGSRGNASRTEQQPGQGQQELSKDYQQDYQGNKQGGDKY
ncbi:KGG domain-containing protein [Pseudoduganella sp. S-14]|jgi:general stress protein YciG|uniref:KGG domain-containing protein n=1 Tax=Pseudoduganella sp. S-14 TaxID=3404065 RepID=UPI003CE6F86A